LYISVEKFTGVSVENSIASRCKNTVSFDASKLLFAGYIDHATPLYI